MSNAVVRAVSLAAYAGSISQVGSGNVLGDNSDSTWIQHQGNGQTYTMSNMQQYTLAANERCIGVSLGIRMTTGFGGINTHFYVQLGTSGPYQDPHDYYDGTYDGSTINGPFYPSSPTGNEWFQADLNSMLLVVRDDGAGVSKPQVREVLATLDLRHRGTIAMTGPVGTNPGTTRRPTATWNYSDPDGQSQLGFYVKVFTLAQTQVGGFNPETSTAFYDSGRGSGANNSFTVPVGLPDNTYRIYVKASKDFRGGDWWTDWTYSSFTISDTPAIPTAVSPTQGSTVNTGLPQLQARLGLSPLSSQAYIVWQLASDSAFSANLRTISVQDSQPGYTSSNALMTAPVPSGGRLTEGTWYIRARAVDTTGKTSGWSNTQYFTVYHPPAATNLSPTGDSTLSYGSSGAIALSWAFSTPAPEGDTQSGYQLIIERNDSGSQVYDSNVVSSNASVHSWSVPIGLKGVGLRWRIRLRDSDGIFGSYSANQLFRASDPPQITIVNPSESDAVQTAAPLIYWNQALTGAGYITAYRVQISDLGAAVGNLYDSGFVTISQATGSLNYGQHQVGSSILKNGQPYSVTVTLRDNGNLTGSAKINTFYALWQAPAPVVFSVSSLLYASAGYVELSWNAATKDAQWRRYNVYHREVGTSDWTFIGSTAQDIEGYVFRDYLMGSGTSYEHSVTQVAIKFGEEVESYKAGENRVFNGSFPTLGGWNLNTGGSLITTDGTDGKTSVEIVDTSSTLRGTVRQDDGTVSDDMHFLVSPGETLRVEFDVKKVTSVGTPGISIFDDDIRSFTGLTQGQWTHRSIDITIANNRSSAIVTAFASTVLGDTVTTRFDNIQVYSVPQQVTVTAEDFWLVDPTAGVAARLYQVTDENFGEEYEEETLVLIGRGRKMDFGTRIGFSGQLTAQLWDVLGSSARQQRLTLELMKRQRHTLYLKNPFGDVLQVQAGTITFQRLPGTGNREYGSVTIPYQELSE